MIHTKNHDFAEFSRNNTGRAIPKRLLQFLIGPLRKNIAMEGTFEPEGATFETGGLAR